MTVSDFISAKPSPQKEILIALRNIILAAHPFMEEKIRYGVPFFDYLGAMCYLSIPAKKNYVYIGFIHGKDLSNEQGILETKERKQIRSISYFSVEEMKEELLREVLQEAILWNEIKHKEKKERIKKKKY